jgi:hypothetical protein
MKEKAPKNAWAVILDIRDSNLSSIHQCIVHEIHTLGTVYTIWLIDRL